jgi:N-acetylmuramic acid 6-phosphate etherase
VGEDGRDLDCLETEALVARLHAGDRVSVAAVEAALPEIVAAVDAVALRLARGGRLRAVGAGTSGRLAVLDAAELWPTYGFPPERWQAVLAGGPEAMWRAREGAEDDEAAGAQVAAALGPEDVLLGVAASGRTPFVAGALKEARRRGALSLGLFCTRPAELDAATDLAIHLDTGPEPIRGSTRMQAGSAQKMALTLLSTAVMVKLKRVYRDLMIDMQVSNAKLRERAVGFVVELTGLSPVEAERVLTAERWSVRRAVARLWTGREGPALDAWLADHPDLRDAANTR